MKQNYVSIHIFTVLLILVCVVSSVLVTSCSGNNVSGDETGTPITITLEVIGPDGSSKEHTVSTDTSKNLRQALEGAGLISGEEGPYGLYVKVVDGITADYDTDGSYWALTKSGVICRGVDSTGIADGDHFEFTYTK